MCLLWPYQINKHKHEGKNKGAALLHDTKSLLQRFPPPSSIKHSLHSLVLPLQLIHSKLLSLRLLFSHSVHPKLFDSQHFSHLICISFIHRLCSARTHSSGLCAHAPFIPLERERTYRGLPGSERHWAASVCEWKHVVGYDSHPDDRQVLLYLKRRPSFSPNVENCCGLPSKWQRFPRWVGAWKQRNSCRWFTSGGRERLEDRKQLSGKNFLSVVTSSISFPFWGGQTLPESLLLRYEKMNHFIVGGGEGLGDGWLSCVVEGLEAVSGFSAGGLGTPVANTDADMSHGEQLDDLSNWSPGHTRRKSFWCSQL